MIKGMARENHQSFSPDTGSEPRWIMTSSGPQKLRSSVKTRVPGHTSQTLVVARRLQRNRRHLIKVPTPTRYDTSGEDSPIPDINSGPTPNVVQVEDTDVPGSSNASPDASDQNAIPEPQRNSSGRLVTKPIRYGEDI